MPLQRLGVCSWSVRPDDPVDLVRQVQATGLDAVQLALTPLVSRPDIWDEALVHLQQAGISVLSGMLEPVGEDYSTLDTIKATGGIRPDAHWPENLAMTVSTAALAAEAGIGCITLHAGFLPHDMGHPERATMVSRLQMLAECCATAGVTLGLETGQEDAPTLLAVLDEIDRPNLGVNFDPANMVLYGTGDPIEAFAQLAPHAVQVHIKDALPPDAPGVWGTEVPVGEGVVDWDRFFDIAAGIDRGIDAIIEREAGDTRVEDIRAAATRVGAHIG